MSRREPGFRFSAIDAMFIIATAFSVGLLKEQFGTRVWLIAVAVGHFFLFCNVFRVRRAYELAWSAVFLCNAAAWNLAERWSWPGVLAVQTPFTLGAIVLEIRSPRYHGILCRRLNADHIENWLRQAE